MKGCVLGMRPLRCITKALWLEPRFLISFRGSCTSREKPVCRPDVCSFSSLMNQGLWAVRLFRSTNRPRLACGSGSFRAASKLSHRVVSLDDGIHYATADVAIRLERSHLPVKVDDSPGSTVGPGAARQRGLDEARGDFIFKFLDSDDLLLRQSFPAQVATCSAGLSCASAYGPVWLKRIMLPTTRATVR